MPEGEIHEHGEYVVVGILKPTGKVIDNLILSNIPSVWQMHHHEEETVAENPAHGEEGHVHEAGRNTNMFIQNRVHMNMKKI